MIPFADTFQWSTFPDGVRFIADNQSLIWSKIVEQLHLSGEALAWAVVIALPLGVVLGHLHRGSFLAINVGNLGRALPSIALIAFGLPIFGVGFPSVRNALIVLAVPPMLTNAYVAVDGVDRELVEAARGMGMKPWQVLTRVELPLAMPLIFAGIRTATVFVIATAPLAAFAGGGTLGDILVNQASYELKGVVGAAICVSILALLADALLAFVQVLVTPKPLRGREVTDAVLVADV